MEYKFENIKGKKYAIHTPTQELADRVYEILEQNNFGYFHTPKKDYEDFGSCGSESCFSLNHENYTTYSNKEYFKSENYIIISAEEFIQYNSILQKSYSIF